MASRLKEDERNERIIRGLLKLPENRRCINCNSLGPQYVCISFWTFVCTTCSGIHREFTHRVKSVSMAKFTTQEVVALQEGGNKSARELFLKDWDSQHNSIPDSSNVNRLRDFIKHVYVDKRYTGDNNYGKPPNMKMSEKKDLYENGRTDSYQGGSRSPPYEDAYDRRINGRSSPGGKSDDKSNRYGHDERRSPGYGQEGRQYNNYRRSTARPEIVNDWRREDRFANGRKTDDDHRVSDGESKFGVRSPARPNDVETSSPPVARPVREILGDNVVPLRVIEPPKSNTVRASDGLSSTQRTVSSSSSESTNENLTEVKRETLASLIDFDSDPMPSVAPAVPQAQSTLVTQTTPQTVAASNDNNWASFDFAPAVKASEVPANPSPLDSVISQLSFMSSVPGPTSTLPNGYGTPPVPTPSVSSYNHNTPGAVPVGSFPTSYPSVSASAATPGFSPIMSLSSDSGNTAVPEAGQWPNMQQQQQPSTVQSTTQQFSAPSNQPWNPALPPNDQATMNATSSAAATGRIELPEDIFAATYNSFPTMNPGWQTRPPGGMMFPMQYANVPAPVQYNNVAAPSPTFVQPSQTANPFDVNEPTPAPAQPFPNMSSLQNALPNTPSASSLGNPTPWMMPNQASPYQSGLYPQLQSYATTAPSRLATSQEPSHMQLPGHQGMPGFGGDLTGFGGINMEQQLAGGFSGGAPLHPLPSAGGNPFG